MCGKIGWQGVLLVPSSQVLAVSSILVGDWSLEAAQEGPREQGQRGTEVNENRGMEQQRPLQTACSFIQSSAGPILQF